MKVLFLPEVEDALLDLIEILYSRQYFSFPESAVTYVNISLANEGKTQLGIYSSLFKTMMSISSEVSLIIMWQGSTSTCNS